jgi:hypothetical protein
MFKIHQWQSQTALLLTLALSATSGTPLLAKTPAEALSSSYTIAQWKPRPQTNNRPSQPQNSGLSNRVSVPDGTRIPVRFDDAEKVIVLPDETVPLTLTVAKDITAPSGTILIPAGSQIMGELRPAEGGSQFIAQELRRRYERSVTLDARSQVVTRTEKIDKGISTSNILKGAAIGAAAATAIAAITGDRAIATEEVLGGAGLGAVGGLLLGRKKETVIVIYPNTDLELTLRSELALR